MDVVVEGHPLGEFTADERCAVPRTLTQGAAKGIGTAADRAADNYSVIAVDNRLMVVA